MIKILTQIIKYILYSLAIYFCQMTLFAQQNKIDSLLIIIKTDKPDTNKINHLNQLGWELMNSNPDTSILIGSQALQLAEKLSWKTGIANSLGKLGVYYYQKGNYPEALDYYSKALKMFEELKNKTGIANYLGNIGIVYNDQADYSKALDYHLKALEIDEELGDKNGIAGDLANIALVTMEQADYSKALDYYFKALKIAEELGNKNSIAIIFDNIGNVYREQDDYPKALDYHFKALKIDEALNNKSGIANCLGNIGIVYNDQADYPKALDYHFKALKIDEELGDKNGIAGDLVNIGSLYIKTGKFEAAEKYLKQSLALADSIKALEITRDVEQSLSQLYDTTARVKLAFAHYKKYIAARDSIINDEKNKKQMYAEMNFEFKKKEAVTKAEQDKKDAITLEEKQRQKVITYSISIGLFLVALLALFIFRGYKQKQKANVFITQQKLIVEEKNKLVEEKQKEILDSIHYAKRIKHALLASDSYLNKNLPEYFILYKPKDIVSGDFYWALQQNDNFLILIGDCTGHGVPGAFMSLLNISFLNEITLERKTTQPDLVLNGVREEIIKALNPEGNETEGKDGMDCILCSFDFKKNTLELACANNPLWIVRNNKIIEYKSDKMPVGKYSGEEKNFNLQKIELQKGDTIYAFTDGYADQFGGSKGKKFKYKQLNEKLLAINHLSLAQQKKELEKTFEDWKGDLEQVDDVTIIGIRL